MRVALATLGCKVNRADGLALLEALGGEVVEVPFDGEADLYIVNSCTVTATADRQTRQLLHRARRQNPAARVVLTGCRARLVGASQPAQPVDRVFTLDEHPALISFVRELTRQKLAAAGPAASGSQVQGQPLASAPAGGPLLVADSDRARPYLKVQDGCDAACSYCIVPRVRGPSRSQPPAQVVAALERLAAAGIGEVVLSGIHLGAYGRDLHPSISLAGLLRRCLDRGPRLRLSSVEPQEVDADLRELLRGAERLCPHLHLPMQSGDDAVLEGMNRPYRSADLIELLQELRRARSDLALGADLIAGFPGESEAQAARTLALVEAAPLTHLHVFPYSPRPGTPAAARSDQVPRSISRARAAALRALGQRKLQAFAAAQRGRRLEVLVERLEEPGRGGGLSENYLRVQVRGEGLRVGVRARVLVEEQEGAQLRGRVVR